MIDGIVKLMLEAGVPITRENYLALAYFGNPPDEIPPEELMEMEETLDAIFLHECGIKADEESELP